jgi:hypothetical protein
MRVLLKFVFTGAPELKETLDQVVKTVNRIKSNALNSRIFTALCEAMDSGYKCLLFHTNVRWLSKGKVLARIIFLKTEVISFFDVEGNEGFEFLYDEKWWMRVAFLSDLFEKLNSLNISLQGKSENIITVQGKIRAFIEKIKLWLGQIDQGNIESFPTVKSYRSQGELLEGAHQTLTNLLTNFASYFPTIHTENFDWVINPFIYSCEDFNLIEAEMLIDLKMIFMQKPFSKSTV